jgi:hypothetical protein
MVLATLARPAGTPGEPRPRARGAALSTTGRRSLGLRGHLLPWDLTGDLEPGDLGDRRSGLYRLQPPGGCAGIAGAFAPSGDRLLAVVGGVRARPGMPMSLVQKDPGRMRLRSPWMGIPVDPPPAHNLAAGPGSSPEDRGEMRHLSILRSVAGRFGTISAPAARPVPSCFRQRRTWRPDEPVRSSSPRLDYRHALG